MPSRNVTVFLTPQTVFLTPHTVFLTAHTGQQENLRLTGSSALLNWPLYFWIKSTSASVVAPYYLCSIVNLVTCAVRAMKSGASELSKNKVNIPQMPAPCLFATVYSVTYAARAMKSGASVFRVKIHTQCCIVNRALTIFWIIFYSKFGHLCCSRNEEWRISVSSFILISDTSCERETGKKITRKPNIKTSKEHEYEKCENSEISDHSCVCNGGFSFSTHELYIETSSPLYEYIYFKMHFKYTFWHLYMSHAAWKWVMSHKFHHHFYTSIYTLGCILNTLLVSSLYVLTHSSCFEYISKYHYLHTIWIL